MFMAIRKSKGNIHWLDWDKKFRKPTKAQRAVIIRDLEKEIRYESFIQWLFFRQWSELKLYANEHGILLIGDIPIFVSGDSADVWAEPKQWLLDKDGFPKVVAGVPPDYFSATGQLWGNPLYDWKYHKKTGFSWWMSRIESQLTLSDIVRIDHFRGLESYWEIPAGAETAIEGKWKQGPGDDFFNELREHFGEDIPIIAEDLGVITDEVRALRDRFNLPGMRILQFAFEDDDSSYLPHNHIYNCVSYTGTHDNDTTTGWYQSASERAKDKVRRYMNTDASQVSWDFIRICFGTIAKYAIVPVQDLLCQGSEYRMNIPGVAKGNWGYRVKKGLLNDDIARRLYDMTKLFGR
jgi:4-alpha-glucanotransferase